MKSSKPKLQKGDRVFVEIFHNPNLKEAIVEWVGTSYGEDGTFFGVSGFNAVFNLKTWAQVSSGQRSLRLWASREEFSEYTRGEKIWARIESFVNRHSCPKDISLEQLEQIAKILGIKINDDSI